MLDKLSTYDLKRNKANVCLRTAINRPKRSRKGLSKALSRGKRNGAAKDLQQQAADALKDQQARWMRCHAHCSAALQACTPCLCTHMPHSPSLRVPSYAAYAARLKPSTMS